VYVPNGTSTGKKEENNIVVPSAMVTLLMKGAIGAPLFDTTTSCPEGRTIPK
jgi:hypothetical protein